MLNSLRYDWVTWCNNIKGSYRLLQQKNEYIRRKKKSNALINEKNSYKIVRDVAEIRLFAVMRNESLRLSHFINYYKAYGVDRLFLIDNNSTDDSVNIGLNQPNVHVFQTSDNYTNHWYWMEHMLEKYGRGHWCVVVDIDELLYFPHAETFLLPDLCRFLDDTCSTALRALLLDMYSNRALKEITYVSGQNPLDSIPYFDIDHYEVTFPYFDRYQWKQFTSTHFTGGMRERVFGKSMPITSLNKFPLFKFLHGTYLGQGMHAINGTKVSELQGVVFHTKFLSDCIQEAQEESVREQHFNKASYYKDFKQHFDANPDLCLATPNSVRFRDSTQLVDLGLMKTTEDFEEYVRLQANDSINEAV